MTAEQFGRISKRIDPELSHVACLFLLHLIVKRSLYADERIDWPSHVYSFDVRLCGQHDMFIELADALGS